MGKAPQPAPSTNALMVRFQPAGHHHIIFHHWAFYADIRQKKIKCTFLGKNDLIHTILGGTRPPILGGCRPLYHGGCIFWQQKRRCTTLTYLLYLHQGSHWTLTFSPSVASLSCGPARAITPASKYTLQYLLLFIPVTETQDGFLLVLVMKVILNKVAIDNGWALSILNVLFER